MAHSSPTYKHRKCEQTSQKAHEIEGQKSRKRRRSKKEMPEEFNRFPRNSKCHLVRIIFPRRKKRTKRKGIFPNAIFLISSLPSPSYFCPPVLILTPKKKKLLSDPRMFRECRVPGHCGSMGCRRYVVHPESP